MLSDVAGEVVPVVRRVCTLKFSTLVAREMIDTVRELFGRVSLHVETRQEISSWYTARFSIICDSSFRIEMVNVGEFSL